jgi:predicted porin
MNKTTGRKRAAQAALAGLMLMSGAAVAQSSVTLYGVIDAWAGSKKALGGKQTFMEGNGGLTASYWGMRGTEDLGNGYAAIFDLESYFSIQNGSVGRFAGDGLFSRNAWVGVKAPWGTVTMGEIAPPLWFQTIFYNPFFNSFTFSPAVLHTYVGVNGQGVGGGGGDWANSVLYTSPNMGGVIGKAMYAFGNVAGHLGEDKWSLQLNYNEGNLMAAALYQQIKYNTTPGDLGTLTPGLTNQSTAEVSVMYNVGILKAYAQYLHSWDSVVTGDVGVNTGQAGLSIPLGPGTILVSDAYSRSSGARTLTRNTWAAGYDYSLSKRTDVYVAALGDRASHLSYGTTLGGGIRTQF